MATFNSYALLETMIDELEDKGLEVTIAYHKPTGMYHCIIGSGLECVSYTPLLALIACVKKIELVRFKGKDDGS